MSEHLQDSQHIQASLCRVSLQKYQTLTTGSSKMMMTKFLTLSCLTLGSVLTYLSGHDIYWSAGIVPLVAYTFGVLIVGAGIRAVLKG